MDKNGAVNFMLHACRIMFNPIFVFQIKSVIGGGCRRVFPVIDN